MAENLLDENKNNPESSKSEEDEDDSLRCGWRSWRPECLQRFNNPKWFILFISIFSLAQGLIVMGLTTVSIPDIEKEFGFTSSNSGLILASNDIAGIILVPLVSFFGTNGKKPKWIGIGALITGFGALLFSMPKAMIGKYTIPGTTARSSVCIPGAMPSKCIEKTSSAGYLAILCLGQFIMGAGTTPLYTLGPAYLDENVNPKVSPIYLGLWFSTTFFGPGLGYMVGGTFLRTFTNVKLPEGIKLSPRDPRWIGAWWMGFFLLAWFLFLSGAALLCFPAEMPKFRKKRAEALQRGDLQTAEEHIGKGIKGMFTATLNLVKNYTFIFAVLGVTVRVFFGSAMGSFFAKIVLTKFGGTTFEIALSMGAVLLPAMAGGIMIGSFIMKKTKIQNSAKTAAFICVIMSALTCFGSSIFLIPGCKTTTLAGATTPYQNSTSIGSLYSSCNKNCACSRDMYNPVCGIDGKSYFSPCYAGCTSSINRMQHTNCSCIPKKNTMLNITSSLNVTGIKMNASKIVINAKTMNKPEARAGLCDRQCKNMAVFLLGSFFVIFISFLSATPQKMILLRCVPDNQRAYALGLQFFLMRSLSFIPGPVIFGSVIDSQCILWGKNSCGKRTNCLDYRVDSLSKNIFYLGISTGIIGTFFYFLAWFFYKPSETTKEKIIKYNAEDGVLIDKNEEELKETADQ